MHFQNAVLFSVIIPTRNRPERLRRALDSVARQSRQDFEIIVVNDGSTEAYDLDHPVAAKMNYIALPRVHGPALARNAGIAAARGRWLSFLDDDDEWEPNFLEVMAARLEGEGDEPVFAWGSFLNLDYGPDGAVAAARPRLFAASHASREQLFSDALSIGTGCGLTLHRSCLARVGPFRTDYALLEDTDFLFRLLVHGCRPVCVPDILVRIHLDNRIDRLTSVARYPTRISEFRRLLGDYADFLALYPSIKTWMWDYCTYLEDEYRSYCAMRGIHQGTAA
jgi:glycosyltransferase involved in cell wall biosynthesis